MTSSSHRKLAGFIPVLAACLILSSFLSAEDVYRGRMLTGKAPVEPPAVNIRIEIKSYTTIQEVQLLQESLNQGGSDGLLAAFQKMEKGVIRVIDRRGWNLPIHAAVVVHTDKGTKVRCFMLRQAWDPGAVLVRTGSNFFMALELTLNEKNKGEGRLYEDAGMDLNPMAGTLEIGQCGSAPKIIVAVNLVEHK